MKNKFNHILLFSIYLLSINNLHAIKATPYPITTVQSDGSEITYYLKGDEFFHYNTTLDNYLLVPDKKGIFMYGIQN